MSGFIWPEAKSGLIIRDRAKGVAVPKKYEFIEHTADLGFMAYGASIEELFAHAAEAFFEAIVGLESVEERIERAIEVEAYAVDNLMVSWLGELLYLYDTERLVFKRFQIKWIEDNHLQASVYGEVLDPARHEIKTGIKAVTYHQLYVKERKGGWEARVIFDI
ncbi:MAG: archease [Deltaproteobacteria bacterium]|nr:archease [Deltaproteobacteria bacterium]MBW2020008.1 archease [Deltaproteobacteria bacterium]MBW2074824.1 archease [Deltaproteobacteria bacterium]RLB82080.1 MAG: archease [Deltaproteobacteria bacterium]